MRTGNKLCKLSQTSINGKVLAMNLSKFSLSKKVMFVPMLASALLLGACSDREAANENAQVDPQADSQVDAQTPVEQSATDMAPEGTATSDGELVDIEQQEMPSDDVATAEAADIQTDDEMGSADGDTVLDGTEQEEHVSTY